MVDKVAERKRTITTIQNKVMEIKKQHGVLSQIQLSSESPEVKATYNGFTSWFWSNFNAVQATCNEMAKTSMSNKNVKAMAGQAIRSLNNLLEELDAKINKCKRLETEYQEDKAKKEREEKEKEAEAERLRTESDTKPSSETAHSLAQRHFPANFSPRQEVIYANMFAPGHRRF